MPHVKKPAFSSGVFERWKKGQATQSKFDIYSSIDMQLKSLLFVSAILLQWCSARILPPKDVEMEGYNRDNAPVDMDRHLTLGDNAPVDMDRHLPLGDNAPVDMDRHLTLGDNAPVDMSRHLTL